MILVLITSFLRFHRKSITDFSLIYLLLNHLMICTVIYMWRCVASDALIRLVFSKVETICHKHRCTQWVAGTGPSSAVILCPSLAQLRPFSWGHRHGIDEHEDTKWCSGSYKKKCFVLFRRKDVTVLSWFKWAQISWKLGRCHTHGTEMQ